MAKTAASRSSAFQAALLAELSQRLSQPTAAWPTVRCWTTRTLKKLLGEAAEELRRSGFTSRETYDQLIEWLGHIGIRRSIDAEGETFHLLEFGARTRTDFEPYELLMAIRPAGVICYSSALTFHSLTTQPIAHHHVAELQPATPTRQHDEFVASTERTAERRAAPAAPPKLGTLLFRFGDAPYYVSRRSQRLIPGVQLRDHGPRTRIRITTLEQSLLDALYKPFHAGGPDVVFESWKTAFASHLIDEDRMAQHLRQMNYPATTRRVGAMFNLLARKPGTELQDVFDAAQAAIDPLGPYARISLIPGIEYGSLDPHWLVRVP